VASGNDPKEVRIVVGILVVIVLLVLMTNCSESSNYGEPNCYFVKGEAICDQ
jgi:hypothetical protein